MAAGTGDNRPGGDTGRKPRLTRPVPAVQPLLNGIGRDTARGAPPRIQFVDKARGGPAGILRYPVSTAHGDNVLQVAPLPFVRDGLIVDTMEDPATWLRSYADRVQLMEAALGHELATRFDLSRDVNVFAAHLYVSGATFDRSEKPIHVSDVYATRSPRSRRCPTPRSGTSTSPSRCPAGR